MGYELIHDPEKDVVVLIDPEYGRALGPVLSGEEASTLLESFVGALGVDPASVPPWILEQRFHEFLSALNASDVETPAEVAGEEHAGEKVVPTQEPAGRTTTPPAPAPASPTEAPSGSTTEPDVTPGSSDTSGTTSAEPAAAADPTAAPSDGATASGDSAPVESAPAGGTTEPVKPTVPEGAVTCPQCDGWGTIAKNGAVVPCPLCEGEGHVTQDVADSYLREQQAG